MELTALHCTALHCTDGQGGMERGKKGSDGPGPQNISVTSRPHLYSGDITGTGEAHGQIEFVSVVTIMLC